MGQASQFGSETEPGPKAEKEAGPELEIGPEEEQDPKPDSEFNMLDVAETLEMGFFGLTARFAA